MKKKPVTQKKTKKGYERSIEAGTKNLINLKDRTPEERKAIASLGGKASAASRSITMKLSWMKRKGLDKETHDKLYDIMLNPDLSALDIIHFIQKIEKNTEDKTKIAKLLIDWHKIHHGDKQKVEHTFDSNGININFQMPTLNDEESKKEPKKVN